MPKDNRIVLDLGKVTYARFRYRNQYGDTSNTKPKFSVRGVTYDPSELQHTATTQHPTETCKQYADRLGLTDVWIPEVKFQLVANHSLTYTGPKAVALWKEWNRRIFKKGK
jgi:hypothetical protein